MKRTDVVDAALCGLFALALGARYGHMKSAVLAYVIAVGAVVIAHVLVHRLTRRR